MWYNKALALMNEQLLGRLKFQIEGQNIRRTEYPNDIQDKIYPPIFDHGGIKM